MTMAAVMIIPVSVKASTVAASVNKDTCEIGDTITLVITSEDADGAAVAPEISITFDPNRLSFTACSTAYGGGDGGLVTVNELESEMTFTALSGGSAGIDVTAIYDGDGANPSMASCTIDVNGEDTASMVIDETASSTGVEAGTIESPDGTKLVSSVFANEFMPKGFYKTTVTYEEQMVEAAQFDMGNIVLLYVSDPANNDNTFCMYDQATGELSDFLQISGIENKFIIALRAGEDVEPPKNFTKATLQWNSKVLEAYAYTGEATTESGPSIGDFFLLYAISSEGNKGWYIYDQNEGTYQRFVEGLYKGKEVKEHGEGILASITQATSQVSDDEGETGLDIKLIIIAVMAVLMIILLIMLIITFVKLRDYESYDYIDEDEEYIPQHEAAPVFENRMPVKHEDISDIEEEEPKEEQFKFRKVKASDLVERDMTDSRPLPKKKAEEQPEEEYPEEEYPEDESLFNPHMKQPKSEKKKAKAEAKAAKKAEKQRRKEFGDFGDTGYVDWESFGSSYKDQEPEPIPEAKKNPFYNMDELEAELDGKEEKKSSKEYPMDMIKNIPANDTNRPVQPKPVQQVDLDDDFEFEFIKLDDD